ncbi:glucuronate isomerase [Staphylococcus equorum]|uniref:glucuronate isomerase n=1 Tax=Staphylococcus equorum TaxID=246432 RepID=UPI0029811501|nr:glucuronate isomerase [Staphylococcus equorum]MDW5470292.1 glucuronate isomerase [Staphylococcus equorum]
MSLINEDFLLNNKPAKKLFHEYAKYMPIIDFHCHLSSKEIYENKNYSNLTQIWINNGSSGDHYKWRLMRANGVPEELITGYGDDYQKMVSWAETIEKAIGNPLYEWTHLELKSFFEINENFNSENVKGIWDKANKMLATEEFSPRNLVKKSNVKVVCTTDDPESNLYYHKLLQKDEKKNGFKVLPTMRPDKAFNLSSDSYGEYMKELGQSAQIEIKDFNSLVSAFRKRFEFFHKNGGRLSDHGLNTFHFIKLTEDELNKVVVKAINNDKLSQYEIAGFKTGLMESLMRLNREFGWTMQYHINVIRSANKPMFEQIGADAGFDSIGTQYDITNNIMKLLIDMQRENSIPKTILYSLNPNDWMELATGMGVFYGGEVQKLQLGSAWWFNDTREGMEKQLKIMAQQSLLANFVGMVTDSRSFLSYSRHEYFRRVLCNLLGEWVEQGRVQEDYNYLGKIVEDISFNNAKKYFGFYSES